MLSSGPAVSVETITPSDSATIAPTRGLWIFGDGTLSVTLKQGGTFTRALTGVPGTGLLLPLSVVAVLAATSVTAVYALR